MTDPITVFLQHNYYVLKKFYPCTARLKTYTSSDSQIYVRRKLIRMRNSNRFIYETMPFTYMNDFQGLLIIIKI